MKCDEIFVALWRCRVRVSDFKYDKHGTIISICLSNPSPFVFCRENMYAIGMGATINRAGIRCSLQESCVLDDLERLFSK